MFTTHIETDEIISVAEFRARVLAKVTPGKAETLVNVARDIVALANNPDLIATRFTRELAQWEQGGFSLYSPQSCVLDSFEPFVVRLNFWPLLPSDPRRRNILARVLSYDDWHDHNFSFLTTNYFGAGYETEIFEYDVASVDGLVGEVVDLAHKGRHQLSRGKVMLFRSGKEIHTQIPPTEVSASINLLMTETGSALQDQYYFDRDARAISGYVESVSSKRNSLFAFAHHLGDEETDGLLQSIAREFPSARTRACAYEALFRRDASFVERIGEHVAADPAPIVRGVLAEAR